MSLLSLKALEIAKSQVGVHEIPRGSNSGPDVMKYLNSVGLVKPNAWCASFIYWCFNEAAKQLNVVNPLFKTGGVIRQWETSKGKFKVANRIPQSGDVAILDHGHGLGHAYIVDTIELGTSLQHSIEGNSNNDGSRDGEEVVVHRRDPNDPKLLGYLRF